MLRYAALRLLAALPLVWGVITLIFVLLELSPGSYADNFLDPSMPEGARAAICARLRCDDPAWVRYLALLGSLARLDLGTSLVDGRPVTASIAEALPNTLLLSGVTLAVAWPTGVLLGTLQAVRHGTRTDTAISVGTVVLHATPAFLLATLLQLVLSYQLGGWIEAHFRGTPLTLLALPSTDLQDPILYARLSPAAQLLDRVRHIVLPGFALGLASATGTARYMRSSVLEVIRQDYVRTARAKGLREGAVVVRHAMRNALLPVITLLGLSVPYLFSGAVLVENIFAWPGMGRLIVSAIFAEDTPVIVACFFVVSLLVVAGNLAADLACALVDPRIRLEG